MPQIVTPKMGVESEGRVIFLVDAADGPLLRRVSPHTYDYVDDTRITKELFDKLWKLLEEEQKQTMVRP
jgi:hypothetical protein